jgi:sulfur carrier protein/molybdopterin synthase sulfur carrier subunit
MKLRVKLMSLFAKYSKEDGEGLTHLEHGSTIRNLAEYLGLPIERVKIVTINGRQGDLETQLSENDIVYIFPPAIGGG